MKGVRINESVWTSDNGNTGKVAIFTYAGDLDPSAVLEQAVRNYVGDSKKYVELMDAHMNCPWMRGIVSGINDMSQVEWSGQTLKQFLRENTINEILNNQDDINT
jgi:hypothetical protein